ncbi:MAG TPA: hypothetical protein P5032_18450 [Candidatus Competibacter sp.]|nr:hypothetical protein [Candidatus Competibacter sp.]
MNRPKVEDEAYINFLIGTPKVCSATEAARVQPERADPPADDAFTRLLHRQKPDAATLWQEAAPQVERQRGVLVVDDSTLDKPYAKKIELAQRHGSGKHRAVVEGIEPPRLSWRLQPLRVWSHEDIDKLFIGSQGASRSHGAGASRRT